MAAYLKYKIASLPDRLRYPLILHCCQNKSYPNIAKQLTISEDNVRKRIQEARKILKQHLKIIMYKIPSIHKFIINEKSYVQNHFI